MRFDLLREYQKEDAQKLASREAMGCFNQQRTGKTPTALAACALRNCQKILIVCPASAVYQWKEEFEFWYERPCLVASGFISARREAIEDWTWGLVISYDSLKTTARSPGHVPEIIKQNPDAVIIDEAHRIRNPGSAVAQSVFMLALVPYRLALTATPAPNHSHEIWAILHFLYPKVFKHYWPFIEENYVTAIQTNGYGQNYKDILHLKPNRDIWLQNTLNEISTSRKRKEVMPWLPDKDYTRVKLPLTKTQKRAIEELEKYWETHGIVTQGTLDKLIRIRQLCLAPALLQVRSSSPKLDWLDQYIKDYPTTPTLIFSKFTSFLKLLIDMHPEVGVIVGATPVRERNETKLKFQKGEIHTLVINTDAGKEALTLDRAEVAIFADKFPPVGDIEQAEDRFVATAQDKADKPHHIIELIMKGSYEEDIYKMIAAKKTETAIVNDYKQHLLRRSKHATT